MHCKCQMNLYSSRILPALYDLEKYKDIPCDDAVRFLRLLNRDRTLFHDRDILHKVSYTISNGKFTYTSSSLTETPAKAAAKIELFMKNPTFLPGTKLNPE